MEKDIVTPIKFEEQNVVFAENQPEYNPLPAHRREDGRVTSCWSMNLWQRLKFLFTGRIYLSLWTGNKPLQPMRLTLNFEE